jgi:hypothetical protein
MFFFLENVEGYYDISIFALICVLRIGENVKSICQMVGSPVYPT